MARTNPGNPLGGQPPHPPSDEDVVDRSSPVDDHLGVEQSIEPPVILAMTGKQAGLLISLLHLSTEPELADVRYRLTCKYIQAGHPGTWIDNITYHPRFNR